MILFEHTVPTMVLAMAVAVTVAASLAGYWIYAKRDWKTAGLALLRVAFLALLAWCLLLPGERVTQTLQQKSRFIVLLDKSQSMTMTPSKGGTNRWQAAQEVLRQDWSAALAGSCDIDVYAFDSEVSAKLTLDAAQHLTPDGQATLFRDAVKKTVGRYSGVDVAGCLLLSDGIDTREASLDWAPEKRPFPIYSVSLEKDSVWDEDPDIQIDAINTPRRVTVGWQTELKAVITGHGTKGQPIPVQLFKDGVLLAAQETQIPAGGGTREVVFPLDHETVGVNLYRVALPPRPGETRTNDNTMAVSVQVLDARNRLLYVEGAPRWESKYLTRVLKDSRQVSPAIYIRGPQGKFITYGVRGDAAPEMQEQQLSFFKIVVLGNISGDELGEERALALVKFVETGGSLVLLGGSKAWSPGGFVRTSLRKVLPATRYSGKAKEGQFLVRLTDAGRTHAAFAGEAGFWDKVPPVLSIFPGVVQAPAARTLVEAGTPEGAQPVILAQNYGQGKVVAIFTDSLWKWQLSPDASVNKPYPRFWSQLISWMCPKEEKMEGKEWEVFLDREQCFIGEEVQFTARWTGEGKVPADAVVNAEVTLPDNRKMPYAMSSEVGQGAEGRAVPAFGASFKGDVPGLFSMRAVAVAGGRKSESDPVSFAVKPFTPESVPRPAQNEALKAITANSGGVFYDTAGELNKALSALQPRRLEQESSEYRSLWQHWGIISCLVLVVGLEWLFRKLRYMP